MLVLKPSEPGMLLDLPLETQQHHPNSIETEYKLRMTRSFADDEIRARFKGNLVDRYTFKKIVLPDASLTKNTYINSTAFRYLAMEKIKERYKDSHHSVQRAAFLALPKDLESIQTGSNLSRAGRSQQDSSMSISLSTSTYFRPNSSYLRDSSNRSSTPRSITGVSVSNIIKRSASNLGRYHDFSDSAQKSLDYHPQDRVKLVHSAPANGARTVSSNRVITVPSP